MCDCAHEKSFPKANALRTSCEIGCVGSDWLVAGYEKLFVYRGVVENHWITSLMQPCDLVVVTHLL